MLTLIHILISGPESYRELSRLYYIALIDWIILQIFDNYTLRLIGKDGRLVQWLQLTGREVVVRLILALSSVDRFHSFSAAPYPNCLRFVDR